MNKQYWLIPVYGFDAQVAVGDTASQAKYATFRAAQDAGYYSGPDGFRKFLFDAGQPSKITESAARAILGHFKAHGQ